MSELRGPRSWLAAGLAALATMASVAGLSGVLEPGRWLAVTFAAIATLYVLTSVLRNVSRTIFLPTGVGLVVTGWSLVVLYAGNRAGEVLVPTAGAWRDLVALTHDAVAFANESTAPAPAIRPLEMLVVAGACLVYLGVEAFAVGWTMGAVAGLPLLALWAPIMAVGFPVPWWAFVAAAVCWLLILAVARERGPTEPRFERRGVGRLVVPAAAVAVVALALGPIASAAPGWGSVPRPGGGAGATTNGTLRLALGLDLRDNLRSRSNATLITYRTKLRGIGPLRLYTLTTFDGVVWQREGDAGVGATPVGDDLLWPEQLPYITPGSLRENTLIDITIGGLQDSRLPLPGEPRIVDAPGRWAYDAARDEVIGLDRTTVGLSYQVELSPRGRLTKAGLRSANGADARDPAYLMVPDTSNQEDVAALARSITTGQITRYDQAMALQMYLRDTERFTYDTEIAPSASGDAVWDFLQSRHGYCVQFSTTMVVMARSLGIPARLGVGFLPGVPGHESDTFVVTGRDAHSWPELYFPSFGWVRFEPTPADQTGALPSWANPYADNIPVPTPDGADAATRPDLPETANQNDPQGLSRGQFSIGRAQVPQGLAVGVGALLAALTAFLVRRLLVTLRTRHVTRTLTPELAWSRLRERLGQHDISWRDSTTPRQAAELVERTIAARAEARWDEDAAEALQDLARAVERERYAPRPATWQPGELEARVATVLRSLELRTRVPADAGPNAPPGDA